MRRMNEVLCRGLPIKHSELMHVMLNETTREEDEAIAHAINHVDALADALESLLNASQGFSNGLEGEYYGASWALAAYRGGK